MAGKNRVANRFFRIEIQYAFHIFCLEANIYRYFDELKKVIQFPDRIFLNSETQNSWIGEFYGGQYGRSTDFKALNLLNV